MAEQHKFIPFEPTPHLTKSLRDPAFKAAYEALEDEFSTLDALLKTREQSKPKTEHNRRG